MKVYGCTRYQVSSGYDPRFFCRFILHHVCDIDRRKYGYRSNEHYLMRNQRTNESIIDLRDIEYTERSPRISASYSVFKKSALGFGISRRKKSDFGWCRTLSTVIHTIIAIAADYLMDFLSISMKFLLCVHRWTPLNNIRSNCWYRNIWIHHP